MQRMFKKVCIGVFFSAFLLNLNDAMAGNKQTAGDISSKEFDISNPPNQGFQKICKVVVHSDCLVDSLEFFGKRTDGSIVSFGKIGGCTGHRHEIEFGDDELLLGVFGRNGGVIDQIGFITNKNRHGPFGGGGGGPFEIILEYPLQIGKFYAAFWGKDFVITNFQIGDGINGVRSVDRR